MSRKRDYRRKSGPGEGDTGSQASRKPAEQDNRGDNKQKKSYGRSSSSRQNRSRPPFTKYNRKVTEEETVEDIKMDINRIEKEIKLEIKEIRSIKL